MTVARLDGNLLDASLVTAAFEIGGEELFDEFHCLVVGDETGGQHDHVRVVVLADQVGDLLVPYESRTDALVLVEGNGHAFARTAESDPALQLPAFDGIGQRVCEIGVIDALLGFGPKSRTSQPFAAR